MFEIISLIENLQEMKLSITCSEAYGNRGTAQATKIKRPAHPIGYLVGGARAPEHQARSQLPSALPAKPSQERHTDCQFPASTPLKGKA